MVFFVEDVANGFGFAKYVPGLNGCVMYPFGVALEEKWANERFVEGHGLENGWLNHLSLGDGF